MFRRPACRRFFDAATGGGAPLFVFFVLLVCTIFFSTEVHARKLKVNPITSIKFGVGFEYGKKWGDVWEGDTFRQNYSVAVGGFAVDPRLMMFDFNLSADIYDNKGSYGNDFSLTKAGLNLVLFKGINRDRGLKLWRYVPSPMNVFYNYITSAKSTLTNYGISMYYNRAGYLRFFGRGGIIYFDNGRTPTGNAGQNRYRVKFNDEAESGDNANANGNDNWNRNGNGNWNRNGNGNWNRNGNGNWNNGASNAEGNVNAAEPKRNDNTNQYASTPWGFAMPVITFDLIHGEQKEKAGLDSREFAYTSGNLRIEVINGYPGRRAGDRYTSDYILFNRFYDSSDNRHYDSTYFQASNSWDKFRMVNYIEKSNVNDEKKQIYDLSGNYDNRYRGVEYHARLGGRYTKIDDNYESYEYGMDIDGSTRYMSKKRLTPNLTASTSGAVSLGRERDVVQDGVRYSGRMLYSLSATERLEYTRFSRYMISPELTLGYSESGAPVSFIVTGTTQKFSRWRMVNVYNYRIYFPMAYGDRTSSHTLSNQFFYLFSSRVSTTHTLSYSNLQQEGVGTVNQDHLVYTGKVDWTISPRAKSDFSCTVNDYDEYGAYTCMMGYKMRLNSRGFLSMSLNSDWTSNADGKDDQLIANYSWNYRQFVSSVDYTYRNSKAGAEEHNLWLKVKRSFYLRMKRFY